MGKSSKDKRDAYYRLAKEQGWRARSAFKLLQLDEEFNLFEDVERVVDLCAAPGSWSQVLSRVLIKGEKFGRAAWEDRRAKLQSRLEPEHQAALQPEDKINPRENVKIVSIDLQPMTPLEGITMLKADITHPSTVPRLLQALDPDSYDPASTKSSHPVDIVLSDGAPDVTGLHDLDIYVQSQLLTAALNLAVRVLKPGGKFVAKIFRAKEADLIYAQLKVLFDRVTVGKPRSSRASSLEAFVVCEGFRPPKGYEESVTGAASAQPEETKKQATGNEEQASRGVLEDGIIEVDIDDDAEGMQGWIAPFLACGDLSSYDADATYHLPKDRKVLDPVQPPTAPPYKRAIEMKRSQGGVNKKKA